MTNTPIDREAVERLANIVQRVEAPFAHKTKVAATLHALRDALDEAKAELQKLRFEAVADKSQILALSEELGEARRHPRG